MLGEADREGPIDPICWLHDGRFQRYAVRATNSTCFMLSRDAAQRADLSAMVDQSSLAPDNFTTLPHFSVSSTISLPKSLGEPRSAMPPRSVSCTFIFGSATPALISLLSLSMISTGVALGAPTPNQPLAS